MIATTTLKANANENMARQLGLPNELLTYATANTIDWATLIQLVMTYGLPLLMQLLHLPSPPLPTPPPLPAAKP